MSFSPIPGQLKAIVEDIREAVKKRKGACLFGAEELFHRISSLFSLMWTRREISKRFSLKKGTEGNFPRWNDFFVLICFENIAIFREKHISAT